MKDLFKQSSLATKVSWLVFAAGIIFADVMYYEGISGAVSGVMKVLALFGMFALGASVIILPIKLRNGDIVDPQQRAVAMAVLALEFALMFANTITTVAKAMGGVQDDFLRVYATYISPVTPILVAGGFLLIWMFDPVDIAKRARHQARLEEEITKIHIETQLRRSVLEGVQRNIDDPEYERMVDAQIRDATIGMLKSTFGTMRLSAPAPAPRTIDVTPTDEAPPEPVTPIQFEPVVGPSVPPIKLTPAPTPPRPAPKPAHTLQSLLDTLGVRSAADARAMLERYGIQSASDAYMKLRTFGRIPADLTRAQFDTLYAELMNGNNNHDAGDDDESRWTALDLNRNGNHPNR